MRLTDIILMALEDVWQRKLRTMLNLIGVVVGCIMLLLTAAGATGSSAALRRLFESTEVVREIYVQPMYWYSPDPPEDEIVVDDALGVERRTRVRDAMVEAWKSAHQEAGTDSITPEDMRALKEIPHVLRLIPEVVIEGAIYQADEAKSIGGSLVGIDPQASKYATQLIVGKTLGHNPGNEVLISEWLAYQMGYHKINELQGLIGQTIAIRYQLGTQKLNWMYSMLVENYKLSQSDMATQAQFVIAFQRLLNDLDATSLSDEQKKLLRTVTEKLVKDYPATRDPETKDLTQEALTVEQRFTVRGVIDAREEAGSPSKLFKMWYQRSNGDLFVHHETAQSLFLANPDNIAFRNVSVVVQSASDLKSVSDAIEKRRMQANSAVWLWEDIEWQIRNVTWVIYGVAAAVLLASALGISNTLLVSVLQRTPEFGILKSLGARDSDLVKLMLCEGILMGFAGATLALGLALLLALTGNWILASYIETRSGESLSGLLFHFSLAQILLVYLGAVSLCVFATVLPAWRACRLDPVVAMRRT